MIFRLKKLNSNGVAHHALIAILVIAAFASFGAWRVFSSSAANTYTFTKSNGCKPGKIKGSDGVCSWYNKIDNIKADCTEYHLQFDGQRCVYNCIAGWFIDDVTGGCKQMQNPPDTSTGTTPGGGTASGGGGGCPAGTVKEGAYCVDWKKRNECAAQHRQFVESSNECKENCIAGWYKKDGKLPCVELKANSATQNTNVTTDECAQDASRCAATAEEESEDDSSAATDDSTDDTQSGSGDEDTATTNGDGTSEVGGCINGARVSASGTCPEDVLIAQATNAAVNTLDDKISKENCELMGREWESGAKDSRNIKKKISGCKVDTCIKKESKIVNQSNGKPFCTGFVAKIDKKKCDDLHRKWLDQVRGCAVRYNQKPKAGAAVVKAKECAGKYTTYVYKTNQSDECLTPSNVQKLRGIAKSTGTPFIKLTNMSKAGICKIRPGVHWNGKRCVKDAPAQAAEATSTVEVEPETPATPGSPIKCPAGSNPNSAGTSCIKTIPCDAACQEVEHGGNAGDSSLKRVTVTCSTYNSKVSPDLPGCDTTTGGIGPWSLPGNSTPQCKRIPGTTTYNATLSPYSPYISSVSYRAYHC